MVRMNLAQSHSKRGPAAALTALLVGVASLLAYLPAVRDGFVSWDDPQNFLNNPNFRGLHWAQLRWMWTNHLTQHYNPLAWMTLGLDYHFWRMNSFGYHLTNILLHSVDAVLFFWLSLSLLRLATRAESKRNQGALIAGAAFAALLFSLHPLRVESVAWVTERRDMLSGIFYLLAIMAYLQRFAEPGNQNRQRKYYWVCLILFVAALLSKEMVVTLPLTLLILDVYPLRRLPDPSGRWLGGSSRWVWLEKLPLLVLSAADGVMTLVISLHNNVSQGLGAMGWVPRITVTVYGMAFYLLKTVAPSDLTAFYPMTPHKTDPAGIPFLLSAAVVLAITAFAIALRRRFPALLAVWAAYTVTLLPVGGIFHNGLQIAADRYTYLGTVGWALLAGVGVMALWRWTAGAGLRRAAVAACAVGVLALLAWRTRAQIGFWHDSVALWGQAVAVEPSALALNTLGAAYGDEGDSIGAVDAYLRAIAMEPKYALAHNNLGFAYLDLHRLNDAMNEFRLARELAPNLGLPDNGIGNVLRMEGKLDEAVQEYQRALQLYPNDTQARKNLQWALTVKESLAPHQRD